MDNEIMELPKGWAFTKISEFTDVIMGQSPSSNTYNSEKIGLPFFQGKAEFTDLHPAVKKWCNEPNKIALPGDILLSVRAPVGTVNIANVECCIGRGLSAIRYPECNKFLFYFFRFIEKKLDEKGTGTTFRAISGEVLKDVALYLPPLPEQHRIVSKIEALFSELDKGIESFKTAREQLKIYRQALLKHAFSGKLTEQWRAENADKLETAEALLQHIQAEREQRYQQQLVEWETNGKQGSKPKAPKTLPPLMAEELAELPELPEGWAWCRLGNTNVDVSDGPFGSNLKSSDYVDNGVRVIRLENIGALEFIEDKESYVTEEKYEQLKNHTVSSGDIVFSSFITENVRVALVPPSITKAINKADCFCVRLSGETLSNLYTVMFLSTRQVFKQLEDQIHGVGRPRINTTQLKEITIPACSAEEQKVIVAELQFRLSEVDQLDQTITTALQQAEALRQSILKKAFSGQLVPQDPNDEPASVLLERIQAEKAALVTQVKNKKKR